MELITGLVENNLHLYSHLLTGYTRCPMFLKKVAEVYKMLKEKNPDLIFGWYLFGNILLTFWYVFVSRIINEKCYLPYSIAPMLKKFN